MCDECSEAMPVPPGDGDDELPGDWRRFNVFGWVGDFHACGDDHEAAIRARYERPKPGRGKP